MRVYLCSEKEHTVSVIIPMYNAEKYISECLESLLIQTFQDFEVIIVDDCSTDNSVSVVEDYAPKFNGRLTITRTKTNSGGGGYVPRRIGFNLARGKYIQFLDADDFLLGSALEVLYNAAEKYETDVVYTSSYYRLNKPNDVFLYKDGLSKRFLKENIEDKIELTIEDPNKNLQRLLFEQDEGNFHACWSKFIRRDFLIENKIIFPIMYNAGDFIWVINVYCHAKRFLRLPTPLYFYRRYNNSSIIRKTRAPKEQLIYWLSTFVDFTKNLHELEKENKVLLENPSYSFMALKKHFALCLSKIDNVKKRIANQEAYEILHNEFAQNFPDLTMTILPFLFSFINDNVTFGSNYIETSNKFKNHLTARLEIKLTPNIKEDLEIISVSDNKAFVKRAGWLPKNEIGYLIQSYAGNLIIIAKAFVNGKATIALRGVDIHDKDDKSKRIPYWIDYTKFILNGKTIFDTLTPTWHDKPFRHNLNVKADEEIKIEIEWLPHRSDIAEPKITTTPKETIKQNVLAVNKVGKQVPHKFNPNLTARIDVKFLSQTTDGDFQILSKSDDKAEVLKPSWFQNNGVGYVIHSSKRDLLFVAKATADGKINFNLRGMDIRSSEDWKRGIAKRIPYWIDYAKFTVNNEIIFDNLTPAWCNEPYTYTADVKAGEEITIKVTWLPHRNDI